jgi:hypothetical protein
MNFTSGKSPTSLVDFPDLSFYSYMLVGGLDHFGTMEFFDFNAGWWFGTMEFYDFPFS